jgi:hypothetical protein
MRSTTEAIPVILSAWDNRAMLKLNPCSDAARAPPPAGAPGICAAPAGTGVPHCGHDTDPSASVLPHCEQFICLPPELAGASPRALAHCPGGAGHCSCPLPSTAGWAVPEQRATPARGAADILAGRPESFARKTPRFDPSFAPSTAFGVSRPGRTGSRQRLAWSRPPSPYPQVTPAARPPRPVPAAARRHRRRAIHHRGRRAARRAPAWNGSRVWRRCCPGGIRSLSR